MVRNVQLLAAGLKSSAAMRKGMHRPRRQERNIPCMDRERYAAAGIGVSARCILQNAAYASDVRMRAALREIGARPMDTILEILQALALFAGS